MQIFKEAENFCLAALTLVEWFYFGNWIKEDDSCSGET